MLQNWYNSTTIHVLYDTQIPLSSCTRKETTDTNILIASRNSHAKNISRDLRWEKRRGNNSANPDEHLPKKILAWKSQSGYISAISL